MPPHPSQRTPHDVCVGLATAETDTSNPPNKKPRTAGLFVSRRRVRWHAAQVCGDQAALTFKRQACSSGSV